MGYPVSLDSFTTKVDGVDDILAAHINALQASIVAVQTELGTLPKASAADVTSRLAVSLNNDGTLKTAAIIPGALSILNAMLAANSVDSSKIIDGTITGTDLAAATITAANIQAATITQTQMANVSIGTAQLIDASVTGAKASAQMSGRRAQAALGTIPTTGSVECYLFVPASGTITGLNLVSHDALVGSDTNFITVTATDLGTNGLGATALTSGTAADTTKLTGGTNGVVALASTSFAVTGGAVTGGEVIKVVFTVSGTLPGTLTNCVVSATISISA